MALNDLRAKESSSITLCYSWGRWVVSPKSRNMFDTSEPHLVLDRGNDPRTPRYYSPSTSQTRSWVARLGQQSAKIVASCGDGSMAPLLIYVFAQFLACGSWLIPSFLP